MIVYLHGFRSAPASIKAQALKRRMEARGLGHAFWCEQLPVSPRAAITLVEDQLARCETRGVEATLVGSSLGGYYANYLAERHGLHAAMVNPAIAAVLGWAVLGETLGPAQISGMLVVLMGVAPVTLPSRLA